MELQQPAGAAAAPDSPLAGHALFADVSAAALAQLERHLQTRRYAAGDVILRAGVPSAELFGLIDGAVRVEVGGGGRRVLLMAPQCFGELSALTGDPVSATVVAQRDTRAWVLSAQVLFDALARESAFFRNVATLLGQRLRERTRRTLATRPRIVLVPAGADHDPALTAALFHGLQHYAPGSEQAAADDPVQTAQRIRRWRDEAPGGAVLLLRSGVERGAALLAELDADDALFVAEHDAARLPEAAAMAVVWRRGAIMPPDPASRWCHALPASEIEAAASTAAWSRERCPALDRVVRRLTGREVGLALSVGAAAGLAHLGVLEVLEADGLPVDFVCGSSMGGTVALAYGRFGSAREATDAVLRLVAEFVRSKGLQWLPRASLVSASRMKAISHALYGETTFAQLRIPAAVVAADLVVGRRVVIDSGSVASAARATAAIPGVFAPVRIGDAVLVDGVVVSRVPTDLLTTRGSGFKLAVLARPEGADASDAARAADHLESRLHRPLGLRAALGGSWRLLGWWDSASQAERADFVLPVATPAGEGFNFAAAEAMIERGRQAALQRLPQVRSALWQALAPGVP